MPLTSRLAAAMARPGSTNLEFCISFNLSDVSSYQLQVNTSLRCAQNIGLQVAKRENLYRLAKRRGSLSSFLPLKAVLLKQTLVHFFVFFASPLPDCATWQVGLGSDFIKKIFLRFNYIYFCFTKNKERKYTPLRCTKHLTLNTNYKTLNTKNETLYIIYYTLYTIHHSIPFLEAAPLHLKLYL